MGDIESDEILAETEMVHWSPKRGPLIGDGHPLPFDAPAKPTASAALAVGAVAFGAFAIGALAIGTLAIGRLAVGRARFKSLKIDRLEVGELILRKRRMHGPR